MMFPYGCMWNNLFLARGLRPESFLMLYNYTNIHVTTFHEKIGKGTEYDIWHIYHGRLGQDNLFDRASGFAIIIIRIA